MPRGNVQHAHRSVVSLQHHGPQWSRHGSHHRRHLFREHHPNGIVRLNRALAGKMRAPRAHNIGQLHVGLHQCRLGKELRHRSHAGGRDRIKKSCARRRVPVVPVLLGQHAIDHQKIAEDADTALRRRTVPRDRCCIAGPLADRAKHIKLNGRAQSRGALVRLNHFKNDSWVEWSYGRIACLHCLASWRAQREVWIFGEPGTGLTECITAIA